MNKKKNRGPNFEPCGTPKAASKIIGIYYIGEFENYSSDKILKNNHVNIETWIQLNCTSISFEIKIHGDLDVLFHD